MESFNFEVVNKIVPISSIRRDFPKEISKGIADMVIKGMIKEGHCFTNAVLVTRYLISQGYSNIRLVDGTYRNLKNLSFGTDWHRYIQYVRPDGRVRYYDATVEFLNFGGGTWGWEYKAVRLFDLSEIEKYHNIYCHDIRWFEKTYHIKSDKLFMISTLKGSDYLKGDCEKFGFNPYIDDKGNYVGIQDIVNLLNNQHCAA